MTKVEEMNDTPESRKSFNEMLKDPREMIEEAEFVLDCISNVVTYPSAHLEILINTIDASTAIVPPPEVAAFLLEKHGPNFQEKMEKGKNLMVKRLRRVLEMKREYLDNAAEVWYLEETPEALLPKVPKSYC